MKPIRWRSVGLALLVSGTVTMAGCWLGRVVDVPTVEDGAVPVQDSSLPPTTGSGGCQWPASTAMGCTLASVSCDQISACPPSWMQANSPGSCPQAGTAIRTETCDGMYRWSLMQANSADPPGDGTLIGACYYDMSTGQLAGIDWQSEVPCGSSATRFGNVPQICHWDAGVTVQVFSCTARSSGDLPDAATGVSCSQQMPCNGGG